MSKTIYIAGASYQVDAVKIPADAEKSAYECFVPEGTVPDGYVPEGTLPNGAVIPTFTVTDTAAVAPKVFSAGTYLSNGMTISAPDTETPTYDTPNVTVSISLSSDEASVNADASATANGKTGVGSSSKTLASLGLVKPSIIHNTKQIYKAGDEISTGTYLQLGASVATSSSSSVPFITEYDYQTYTPSSNVRDNVNFTFSALSDVPDMIIITAGQPKKIVNYDFGGCMLYYHPFGMLHPGSNYFYGHLFDGKGNYSQGWTLDAPTSSTGAINVTKDGFTYVQANYGSNKIWWRQGWTYHIIAMRLKLPE